MGSAGGVFRTGSKKIFFYNHCQLYSEIFYLEVFLWHGLYDNELNHSSNDGQYDGCLCFFPEGTVITSKIDP